MNALGRTRRRSRLPRESCASREQDLIAQLRLAIACGLSAKRGSKRKYALQKSIVRGAPLNAVALIMGKIKGISFSIAAQYASASYDTDEGRYERGGGRVDAPCERASRLSSKLSSNLPYASNRTTPPRYAAKGLGKESEWGTSKCGGDPTLTHPRERTSVPMRPRLVG